MTLDMPGADLPGTTDPSITDIIPGALAAIDPALPGASSEAASALGIEAGAGQVLLILVDGFGYELMQEHLGHTPTLRSPRLARARARERPTWWASPSPTGAAS